MTVEEYRSFKSHLNSPEEDTVAIIPKWIAITERQRSRGNPPDITESFSSYTGYDKDKFFSNYAMVHRKCLKRKGDHEKTDVEIQCRTIQAVVRKIIGIYSYPGILADPIVFSEPCYPLFQFRDELSEYAESKSNPLHERQHLAPLMDFMKNSESFKELQDVQEQQVSKGLISFKHTRLLFRPGDIIIGYDRDVRQCWLVQYTASIDDKDKEKDESSDESSDDDEKKAKKSKKHIEIYALNWDFDGEKFGPCYARLKLRSFSGLRAIRKLKYFPVKYLPDNEKEDVISELIARGRRWCELVGVSHWNYKGIAKMVKQRDYSHRIDMVQAHATGEVVLDPKMFMEVYPRFKIELEEFFPDGDNDLDTQENGIIHCEKSNPCPSSHREFVSGKIRNWIEPEDKFVADELQALLSPGVTPGWSLSSKFWGYFRVDSANLQAIEWKDDPTQDLHIDPKHRRLIRALIKQHNSEQEPMKDVVAGKGSGLIILLNGTPGCGKTLTAELFAKQERRPLYSVSANDLGDWPYQFESKLQRIFKAAQLWKAILLIDEADMFLGKRSSSSDYSSRVLTSLFLRRLEYFQGIMFLTTNRFIDFDEAFASRVQLILQYPALGPDHRAKIWEEHVKNARISPDWNLAEKCREFGQRYELNGRDIRNLAQVSINICQQEGQPLSEDMIEEIFELRYRRKGDIRRFMNPAKA
ncbi:P-loop containing nucleoside triphosphate hydrolase protein [Rhizodiscina lignyota]|uniref:P-loop containing nucleoside triphosphate hydrolase protein n=1 Tax=Rhizodiscina lignyota TaxID=1504668 RepID=A0A9P4IFD2_9PEZI|nr:P-loop containing nucleoside triphosphate hydrolase protein [Rhizodiscina lignyota]